jgi:hypothetical protein
MTVERQIKDEKKAKAIMEAEQQYLDDYNIIEQKQKEELEKEIADSGMKIDNSYNNAELRMPDLQQILLDQNKLSEMQRKLADKKQTNERAYEKNAVIKRQLAKLNEAVDNYKNKIRGFDTEIKSGRRVMELPCNHGEAIN